MSKEIVTLWETAPGMCEQTPTLEIYLPEEKTSDLAVVILPGGGYCMRAPHEGESYARFFNSRGIAAFVCQYRVYPHKFPLPLLDARRAVRYVRYHARRFGIDENKVYLMGSSAGGHLAALTCTWHQSLEAEGADDIDKKPYLPNGQILCYPVIALTGENAHLGSARCLLPEDLAQKGGEFSPHLLADASTPRAFLWHTFDDPVVSVNNSLLYAERLRRHNVSAEVHIYPQGPHGLGLAENTPRVCRWPEELLQWLTWENQEEKE